MPLFMAVLLLLSFAPATAQECESVAEWPSGEITDPCCRIAEGLFASGFWDEAVTEYQRYLYWQPRGAWRPLCLHRLTICWQRLGRPDLALDACMAGQSESRSPYMKGEYGLEAGELLLGLKQEVAAATKARQVLEESSDPRQRVRARSLQIRSLMAQDRFEDVRSALALILREMRAVRDPDPVDSEDLRLAIDDASLRSPGTSRLLSTIVPGAGQLYAGRPGGAINALALTGSLGHLLVSSSRDGDVGLAFFSFYLLRRYYHGNRHHAERACLDRNRAEIGALMERVLGEAAKVGGSGAFREEAPSPCRDRGPPSTLMR
ncbi:MAG: hypothetical protein IPK64_17090 [bacterium]|nr:hypothetical protein [bacterium]